MKRLISFDFRMLFILFFVFASCGDEEQELCREVSITYRVEVAPDLLPFVEPVVVYQDANGNEKQEVLTRAIWGKTITKKEAKTALPTLHYEASLSFRAKSNAPSVTEGKTYFFYQALDADVDVDVYDNETLKTTGKDQKYADAVEKVLATGKNYTGAEAEDYLHHLTNNQWSLTIIINNDGHIEKYTR